MKNIFVFNYEELLQPYCGLFDAGNVTHLFTKMYSDVHKWWAKQNLVPFL